MKLKNILLRVCVLICSTSAIFATMPPPENGLEGLKDWTSINVKCVDTLPEGPLDGPYEHTEGSCKKLVFVDQFHHDKNLFEDIAIQELKVGEASNFASKKAHPFCLGCDTYCINGKCGYSIKEADYYFEQGLATIAETI